MTQQNTKDTPPSDPITASSLRKLKMTEAGTSGSWTEARDGGGGRSFGWFAQWEKGPRLVSSRGQRDGHWSGMDVTIPIRVVRDRPDWRRVLPRVMLQVDGTRVVLLEV